MLVLHTFVTDPHPCPYLPDRTASLEYSYAPVLSGEEYQDLMDRGYRKFGPLFFRPMCANCRECRSLRIPVAEFKPDRSQRRCWKRNQDLTIRIASPTMDEQRLALFDRYHRAQHVRKGWDHQPRDPEDYELCYVRNPVPSAEVTMWEGDALRAVLLTDITPNVVSGIYHFWDPDHAARGLGTFCMLHTIELARRLEKPWAYFGYYVAGCGSLEYKVRFKPYELMDEQGDWRPMTGG